MGWRDLSADERDRLLLRKRNGEDLVLLAQEVGANVETLSRALRKHAEELRGEPSQDEPKPRVQIREQGNVREIVSTSERITTLEQLLDYCQVNPNEWIVERHEINKWEAARKDTRKDLTFGGGQVEGYVQDSGGFNVEPLFQVKVTLVRRKPQAIQPVIKPVTVVANYVDIEPPTRKLKAALILPDPQFGFSRNIHNNRLTPFHDRRALDAVWQIAKKINPDVSLFLGDINDLSAWSDKFIRMPEFYFTTQPSLIESAWYIGRIKSATWGDTYVLDGNHDVRMEVQIVKHLTEAYQLRPADKLDAGAVMGLDNLLGLTRMGVIYVPGYPDGEVWLNDTTKVIHGVTVRGGPGQTASAVVRAANETTIFGHIHRNEMASRTIRTRDGLRYVTAYSPGCLCRIDGVVPGSSKDSQWQQGAAVVWYDEEVSHIQPIDIQDGCAFFNGEVFVGRDYVEDLKRDTDWNF